MKRINVTDVYQRIQSNFTIGIHNKQIYTKTKHNWTRISDSDLAISVRNLFTDEEQRCISVACIDETIARLKQSPKLQLTFVEDTEQKYVKLKNAVFNTESGTIETLSIGDFGYCFDFEYLPAEKRDLPIFTAFVESVFPEETDAKRLLLTEMMGYILSDYIEAKTGFFFIGESNSGKSTILNLIQRIFPKELVTTLPLHHLSNQFKLAHLSNSRLNICSELTEKSFAVADIFKMLTSSETVTASHKHGREFAFQLRCKSLNAGNCIPEIKNAEGASALVNRMTVLMFPVSIPKEQQDLNLVDKLWNEKDAIFSECLDALVQLKARDFCFTEPKDSIRLKNRMLEQGSVIQNFINECCVPDNNGREHLSSLYSALKDYCDENLLEMKYTPTHFSQYLCQLPNIRHSKFRLHGSNPLAGILGLRLKRPEEYMVQDSHMYSDNQQNKTAGQNIGTLAHINLEGIKNENA